MKKSFLLLLFIIITIWNSGCQDKVPSGNVFNAAIRGDVDDLKYFLKDNPSLINAKDTAHSATLLHWAACHDRVDACKFLLSKGADINSKDRRGEPAEAWCGVDGILRVARCLGRGMHSYGD